MRKIANAFQFHHQYGGILTYDCLLGSLEFRQFSRPLACRISPPNYVPAQSRQRSELPEILACFAFDMSTQVSITCELYCKVLIESRSKERCYDKCVYVLWSAT
jgi:hypothetical protein